VNKDNDKDCVEPGVPGGVQDFLFSFLSSRFDSLEDRIVKHGEKIEELSTRLTRLETRLNGVFIYPKWKIKYILLFIGSIVPVISIILKVLGVY